MAGFPQRGELVAGWVRSVAAGRDGPRRAGRTWWRSPDAGPPAESPGSTTAVLPSGRGPAAAPPARTPAGARSVAGVLRGRDEESARLHALVDAARAGQAGTLLLHGEPGVGKSALLEDLVMTAGADVRVLRAQGVESEAPLPFAALHRLLLPVLGFLDRLPGPQARALRAAFGQADDVAVQPFLTALATLSLLTEAAEDATVLCVLDDAQWLDQATADAVLVAARRLGADRVAVVFAVRDGVGHTFAPDGLRPWRYAAVRGRRPGAAHRRGRCTGFRRGRGPADDPGGRQPAGPG